MVLLDGVTFACQSCIKGHRSKKCTHTTRPLTEIGRKGRPPSQCEHCRTLRKTRSVHGKCDCVGRELQKKRLPLVFPDGLESALVQPVESAKAPTVQISQLLNPCNCRRGGKCSCCTVVPRNRTTDGPPASAASTSGSCCSKLTPTPAFTSPTFASPTLVAPAITSCSSTPPPSFLPSSTPASSSCCAPPPPSSSSLPPPFPTPSSSLLFLPSTLGTSSCFCGSSCTCIGCPSHDPYSRKTTFGTQGPRCECGTSECAGDGCEEVLRSVLGDEEGRELWKFVEGQEGALPSFEELLRRVGEERGEEKLLGWTEGGNVLVQSEGCSVMNPEAEFDGGCGDMCTCSEECGCRTGVEAGVEGVEQESLGVRSSLS